MNVTWDSGQGCYAEGGGGEGRLRFATNSGMYNEVTQAQQHVQHRTDNGRKLCCVAEFQAETGWPKWPSSRARRKNPKPSSGDSPWSRMT